VKVLFWDIESTSLDASWGRVLAASFVELKGKAPYTFRNDEPEFKGKNAIDDINLVVAIRDELEKADIVVGWNSILFDAPMLNARLALGKERGLRLGERYGSHHLDLMYYAGGQSLRIGSKKLDNVAKYFKTKNQKTPLEGTTWQLAGAGDANALNLIVEHCEADCLVLREVYYHLVPYVQKVTFKLSEVHNFVDQIPSRTK
jgi:uncharacterized protein YprB with RNaseH-like and TPR domain